MNPAPLPISVCMLCRNEAQRLPAALARVRDFAEWIVLDTGSDDGSPELAQRLGASVRTSQWLGFSETRRLHFGMAAQPWILWIDADEVVTPALVSELRALLQGPRAPAHQAWALNRVMRFQGRWVRHGEWYPDWNLRLFRTDAWSLDTRAVHENVRVPGSVGRLKTELPHDSYRDWPDRERRIRAYARLWAEQAAAEGKTSGPVRAFGSAGWRFLRGALLKGGFLDGVLGWRIAASCARETYLKHRFLIQR